MFYCVVQISVYHSGLTEIFLFSNCFTFILGGVLSDSIESGFVLSFCRTKNLIASIEIDHQTHRKVPVPLCSITEPIEQQSDRLGSIDFWFDFVRLTTPGTTLLVISFPRYWGCGNSSVSVAMQMNRRSFGIQGYNGTLMLSSGWVLRSP